MKQVFATQIQKRTQKVGESLQEFAADVQKMIHALEVEAVYSSSRTCYKVSVAETEKEENNKIEKLLEKLFQQIDGLLEQ